MSQPQSFDLAVITADKHSCFEVHDLFAVYDYHHPINKTPSKSHFIKFNCPLGEVQLLDRRLKMDHQIGRKCKPFPFMTFQDSSITISKDYAAYYTSSEYYLNSWVQVACKIIDHFLYL